jgi:mannonate dehydratase
MDRREFVRLAGSGMAATAIAETVVSAQQAQSPAAAKAGAQKAAQKVLFKVGTGGGASVDSLKLLSTYGVNNVTGGTGSRRLDEAWSVDSLSRRRDLAASYGVSLDMLSLPMSSSEISIAEMPDIYLAGPSRDRQIDEICQMIRNSARAGIFKMKYNFTFLGVVRTSRSIAKPGQPDAVTIKGAKGRGESYYNEFIYEGAKQDPPQTIAGPVSEDLYWERITYFLERVVPVATEYKVKIGCHPQDPGMPKGKGWRGIQPVLGMVDGLKKFVSIMESPFHGLNFCMGTVAEMLVNPNDELPDIIRYFGMRKKIHNVHFRNIQGGFLNFRETFIDNGDIDMLKMARVYKEVGYEGMLQPDHMPLVNMEGPSGSSVAGHLYALAYIKAVIAAVSSES